MDNRQIKDGVLNLFTVRMRDISPGGDGSMQRTMVLSSAVAFDYGAGGIFQHCGKSGVMAAGLAANAPIYSFQWPASLIAAVTRVKIGAWCLGTAFTAGLATFDMFVARSFTAPDTGGVAADLTGSHALLRTSMASSQASIMYAATGALTPGTRTLDHDPIESRTLAAPAVANAPFGATTIIFEKPQGEHQLLLLQDEGFVIRASVPVTGTWGFAVTTEWIEMSNDILRGLGS